MSPADLNPCDPATPPPSLARLLYYALVEFLTPKPEPAGEPG